MYSIHLHIKMWHFSVKGCMRTCGKELDWSALNRRFRKTHLMFIGRRFHLAGPRIARVVLCPVIDAKVITDLALLLYLYFGICMWSTFPGEAKTGNWCESDNGFGAAANLTPSPRWETFPPNILRARQWVAIDDVERNVRLVMLPFDPEVLLWTATKCTFLGFFTIAKENHHNSILQLLGNPFLRWFGFSWRKCLFLLSW